MRIIATCIAICLALAPPARAAAPDTGARTLITRAAAEADSVPDPGVRLAVYRELLPLIGRTKEQWLLERVGNTALSLARANGDRLARGEICGAIAVGYALAGNHDAHERWLHEAIESGAWTDHRVAWPALARARLEGGDVDGAGQLAAQLDTPTDRANCTADLAGIAARLGDRESAAGFLRVAWVNARAAYEPSEALSMIADAQVLLGDRIGAEQTAVAMPLGFWRARAMGTIAGATLRAGDAGRYRRLITEAEQSARTGPSAAARATALLAVARLRAEAGDAAGAKETVARLDDLLKGTDDAHLGGVHLALAGVLLKAGDPAGADRAAKRATASFKGARISLANEDIAASLAAAGDMAGATTAALAIDQPAVRGRALARVAQGWEAAGKLPELAQLAGKLDAEGWAAARVIGRAHTRAGNPDAITALALEAPNASVRSGLWAGAAEARTPTK